MSYDPEKGSLPPRPERPTEPKRKGILCPKCGKHRFRVVYIRYRVGADVRVCECKNEKCKHRIRTVERIESTVA